jgi:hypothetical protein
MLPPYAALWSTFRGSLGHYQNPINRLACFGYGFVDEHVNSVIEAALARTDFTLLIFTKALFDVLGTLERQDERGCGDGDAVLAEGDGRTRPSRPLAI